MRDISSTLAACPLFSSLTPAELEQIAGFSRSVSVRAGDMLFREGQTCDGFFVVVAGSVRLFKISPDGRERTLHVARPPHAFAEAALFGPRTYPAFASAAEDGRVILIRREPFLQRLRDQPETALRLFESLSRWLHRLLDQLENETFLNARAKLANYLLREARQQDGGDPPRSLRLRQPKKDVATSLGMAPETLSRALADLEARDLVRSTGRQIDLLAPDGLERLLLGG